MDSWKKKSAKQNATESKLVSPIPCSDIFYTSHISFGVKVGKRESAFDRLLYLWSGCVNLWLKIQLCVLNSEYEKTKDCEAVKDKRTEESLYISIYAQMARINYIVFNVFFFWENAYKKFCGRAWEWGRIKRERCIFLCEYFFAGIKDVLQLNRTHCVHCVLLKLLFR